MLVTHSNGIVFAQDHCSRTELCSKLDFIAFRRMSSWAMTKNKSKKESAKATLAGVTKEMAHPRLTESARKDDEANHHGTTDHVNV